MKKMILMTLMVLCTMSVLAQVERDVKYLRYREFDEWRTNGMNQGSSNSKIGSSVNPFLYGYFTKGYFNSLYLGPNLIGLTKTVGNKNSITLTGSFYATDTVSAGVFYGTWMDITSIGVNTIMCNGLPTFSLASGIVTPILPFDTVGVNIANLTTSAKIIVSYGEAVGAADTIASVYALRTGRATFMGEHGKKLVYMVVSK